MMKHCTIIKIPTAIWLKLSSASPSCPDGLLVWLKSSSKGHNKLDRKQCEPDQEGPESKLPRRIESIQCDATTQEPDRVVQPEGHNDQNDHEDDATSLESSC